MGLRRPIALALAFLAVAAAAGLLGPHRPGGGGGSLALPLHRGDVVEYNVTFTVYVDGSLNGTRSGVARLTVDSLDPPLVAVNSSEARGGRVEVPYGVLALPASVAGAPRVRAPVAVGYTWLCMEFSLAGLTEGPLGRAVVYEGSLDLANLTVRARLEVDEATGVVVGFKANVTVSRWGGGSVTLALDQELVDYKPSGGAELRGDLPEGFVCGNGFSSDLRLTLEGLYVVEGSSVSPAGLGDLEAARAGGLTLAVLDKRDPASWDAWGYILRAARESGARVYVLVVDPASRLVTPDAAYVAFNIVQPVLNRLENPRLPLLMRLGPGGVESVESGPVTYGDVEAFIAGG